MVSHVAAQKRWGPGIIPRPTPMAQALDGRLVRTATQPRRSTHSRSRTSARSARAPRSQLCLLEPASSTVCQSLAYKVHHRLRVTLVRGPQAASDRGHRVGPRCWPSATTTPQQESSSRSWLLSSPARLAASPARARPPLASCPAHLPAACSARPTCCTTGTSSSTTAPPRLPAPQQQASSSSTPSPSQQACRGLAQQQQRQQHSSRQRGPRARWWWCGT